MRRTLLIPLVAALCACDADPGDPAVVGEPVPADQAFLPPAPDGKRWVMTFRDEFDGTVLDDAKWTVYGGTMAEPQPRRDGFWVQDAVSLDGEGHLAITTFEQDGKYYDGGLGTDGKFSTTFGYIEARVKMQREEGHWFGWWMMPAGADEGREGGVDGTEIDIAETPYAEVVTDQVQLTLHWDFDQTDRENRGTHLATIPPPADREAWHTFAVWWKADEYAWYIDGVEAWHTSVGGVCHVPEYLILTDEISDTVWFLTDKIANAVLPDRTLVDYVRVFQLTD